MKEARERSQFGGRGSGWDTLVDSRPELSRHATLTGVEQLLYHAGRPGIVQSGNESIAGGHARVPLNSQKQSAGAVQPRVGKRTLLALLAALIVLGSAAGTTTAGVAAAPTVGLPQPSTNNSLSGVSCVSAADCWAVGSAEDMNNNVSGEVLRWNGASWTLVPTPAAPGGLTKISCASASSCMAVGYTGNGSKAFAIRSNGTAWTQTPLPALSSETINGVSCTSSTDCWLAGATGRSRNMLALHWTGSRWVQTKTLPPDRYGETLDEISCTDASSCWAFGTYYGAPLNPTVANYLTVLRWNGSAWHKVWTSTPFLGGDSSQTVSVDVTCLSASQCLGAGAWGFPEVYSSALELRWNGKTWSEMTIPHLQNGWLNGVACTSSRSCLAVGSIGTLGSERTLTLRYNGSGWSRVQTPRAESLSGVSCASTSECWVVGAARAKTGSLNFAQRWTGTTWI